MDGFNVTNANGTVWVSVAGDIFWVMIFFLNENSHQKKCCQFTCTWLLPWWRRWILSAELWCNYKPLSLASHFMFRFFSNMPSAVSCSYKPPLRYLIYILQDLANPSVLLVSYPDIHLLEVAVVAVRVALFQTEQLTQCFIPQSFLKGKTKVWLSLLGYSVGITAVSKHMHLFCSKYSWMFALLCSEVGLHMCPGVSWFSDPHSKGQAITGFTFCIPFVPFCNLAAPNTS